MLLVLLAVVTLPFLFAGTHFPPFILKDLPQPSSTYFPAVWEQHLNLFCSHTSQQWKKKAELILFSCCCPSPKPIKIVSVVSSVSQHWSGSNYVVEFLPHEAPLSEEHAGKMNSFIWIWVSVFASGEHSAESGAPSCWKQETKLVCPAQRGRRNRGSNKLKREERRKGEGWKKIWENEDGLKREWSWLSSYRLLVARTIMASRWVAGLLTVLPFRDKYRKAFFNQQLQDTRNQVCILLPV